MAACFRPGSTDGRPRDENEERKDAGEQTRAAQVNEASEDRDDVVIQTTSP
jgi:hypothetical protein